MSSAIRFERTERGRCGVFVVDGLIIPALAGPVCFEIRTACIYAFVDSGKRVTIDDLRWLDVKADSKG